MLFLCSYTLCIRSFVTPTYKVGLALAMIYTAKIFSIIKPLYQKDSRLRRVAEVTGQAGMTSIQKLKEPIQDILCCFPSERLKKHTFYKGSHIISLSVLFRFLAPGYVFLYYFFNWHVSSAKLSTGTQQYFLTLTDLCDLK
jgi:hypothetical protein